MGTQIGSITLKLDHKRDLTPTADSDTMSGRSHQGEGSRRMALLTPRVAAQRLGVGYSTLKRWVRNGRVRTTRTEGGHHRVAETEIDRLLAPHQPPARKQRVRTDEDESLGGLSARNRLFGYIEEVRVDGLLAQVQLRVGDQRLTAVVTADAVRALKLRRGEDAIAIVKSTEVMIARPPLPRQQTKQNSRDERRR